MTAWIHEMITTHQTMKDRLMTDITDDMRDNRTDTRPTQLIFSTRKANEELTLTPLEILRAALVDQQIELDRANNCLTGLRETQRCATVDRDSTLARISSLQVAITMLSNDETVPETVRESVNDLKRCDW